MKLDFYKFFGYVSWLRYILWLLLLNAAMLATNLPFMVCACFLELKLFNLPVFLVAGLTIGPSVLAAYKTFPGIEESVLRNYFQQLRSCWKRALKFWTPVWTVLVILFADIMILEALSIMTPLKWVSIALLCLLSTYLLTFFAVWAEWDQSIRAAALLTAKLALVKPIPYNLNFLILLGTVVLLALKPIYLVLYGSALTLFLVRMNFAPVIQFVKERPENQ